MACSQNIIISGVTVGGLGRGIAPPILQCLLPPSLENDIFHEANSNDNNILLPPHLGSVAPPKFKVCYATDHNDPEFALTMRMLPALAFVPPELFDWSFQQLIMTFPENAFPLYRYFEENYIGILNLNGERNTPLFPISLWNNFHLVPQGLPRSTNLIEAWLCGFQSTCGCHHPTIWKFIDCLKREQGNVELKELRFTHGEDPKKTKKSIDNEKAILNLVTSFFHRSILVYLRGLAFRTIF